MSQLGSFTVSTAGCTIQSLSQGGTGSDLSATGPGVVIQATMGAVLTVAAYLPPSMGGLGIDASGAASGQVPIADGLGGFVMGALAGGGGDDPSAYGFGSF